MTDDMLAMTERIAETIELERLREETRFLRHALAAIQREQSLSYLQAAANMPTSFYGACAMPPPFSLESVLNWPPLLQM